MIDTKYSPDSAPEKYGQAPESCEKECEALCKGKTIKELRQIADFFNSQASAASRIAETTIKYEDFEKAKKSSTQSIPTMETEE